MTDAALAANVWHKPWRVSRNLGVRYRTVEQLAALWIDGKLKRGEIAANTATTQRSQLKTLTSLHGHRPVADLDRHVIDHWLEAISHHTAKTRYCERVIVGNFCRWLVAEGHLSFDPTAGLPRARMPRTLPKVPRSDSVGVLLDHLADDLLLSAVVWVMLGCGLRCVDTSNLDLEDYDPDRLTLRVKGKGGHERFLPVPEAVADALDLWITEGRGHRPGPMFIGPRARRRITAHRLSYLVARAMKQAGVHKPHDGKAAHSLRRKAATDVLENCRDLRVAKQMLGHRSLATTEVYLELVDLDRLRDAMEGRHYIRGPTVRRSLRGTPRSGATSPVAGSPTKREKRQKAG